MRFRVVLCILAAAIAATAVPATAQSSVGVPPQLNDIVERHEIPLFHNPHVGGGPPFTSDPLIQSGSGGPSSPTIGLGYDGLGLDFSGFTEQYIPPDTNGAAGTAQFVQIVNVGYAAFDKTTGHVVAGPAAIHTIWANAINKNSRSLASSCKTNDGGDPIIQYDKVNHVWVMMQIQYSAFGGGKGDYICMAVSNGDDWTQSGFNWYAYSLKTSLFPDYPKLGIWNDGYYYVTYNGFKGFGPFVGPVVCAFNSTAMRQGQAITPPCTTLSGSYFSLLPGDVDSAGQQPISGESEYLISMGSNSLLVWRASVSSSTLQVSSQPQQITTTAGGTSISFQPACGGGTCIPQLGTTQQLDSLGDRLMYRLAYRHFSGYGSLVVTQSVTASSTGSATGIRWYELRHQDGDSTVSINQGGTYAPDTEYRWMGSAAMDSSGNIAVGYSISGNDRDPSVGVATRCSADTSGTLGAETTVLAGAAPQTGASRWGDYSSMSADPDGKTFWFTTEYPSGTTDYWNTKIVKFTISCT